MKQFLFFFCVFSHVLSGADGKAAFLSIFSYGGVKDKPSMTHTFATFVALTGAGKAFSEITISWLPGDHQPVSPLALQDGENYSLKETMAMAKDLWQKVSVLGPYKVSIDLFNKANTQRELLQSGNIQYKMYDWMWSQWLDPQPLLNLPSPENMRPALNCYNAVARVTGTSLTINPKLWGREIAPLLREHFQIRSDQTTYNEVLGRLGLRVVHGEVVN